MTPANNTPAVEALLPCPGCSRTPGLISDGHKAWCPVCHWAAPLNVWNRRALLRQPEAEPRFENLTEREKAQVHAAPSPTPAEEAGRCTDCEGPVYHRDGNPGEFDHQCTPSPTPAPSFADIEERERMRLAGISTAAQGWLVTFAPNSKLAKHAECFRHRDDADKFIRSEEVQSNLRAGESDPVVVPLYLRATPLIPAHDEAGVRAEWIEREAWSFLRNVLNQGRSIEMDYQGGKYPSYEHLSARLDEAARERRDQMEAALLGDSK